MYPQTGTGGQEEARTREGDGRERREEAKHQRRAGGAWAELGKRGGRGRPPLTCSCRWSHMPTTGFRYKPACVATSTCGRKSDTIPGSFL